MAANQSRRARNSRARGSKPVPPPVVAVATVPEPPFVRLILLPFLLLVCIGFYVFVPVEEYDLWFHLAFARYLTTTGHFPPGDIFSFTSFGREWISTGWLGSVILNWLWEHPGHRENVAPLSVWVFLQVAATYLSIYYFAAKRRLHWPVFFMLLPALLASALRFNPRPDVASQLCIALLFLLLISIEHPETNATDIHPKRRSNNLQLFLIGLLVAVWANLHVGFMAGLVPLAALVMERAYRWSKSRRRVDGITAISCSLGCLSWLVNPYGWGVMRLPGKINSMPGIHEMLFEWMPLFKPPANLPAITYISFGLVILIAAIAVATSRQKPRPWEIISVLFLLYITWTARRQLAISAVALVVLALPYSTTMSSVLGRKRWVSITAAAAATGILLYIKFSGLLVSGGWPSVSFSADTFPTGGVEFLRKHRPPANLFNSYHYGSYLLYELGPETKVFIDGRVDTYDPQIWSDDREIEAGRITLQDAEARYKLNTYILDSRPGYDPGQMVLRLSNQPDKYANVYLDDNCAVFVRKSAETQEYLRSLKRE